VSEPPKIEKSEVLGEVIQADDERALRLFEDLKRAGVVTDGILEIALLKDGRWRIKLDVGHPDFSYLGFKMRKIGYTDTNAYNWDYRWWFVVEGSK
jgi:hypothetical protein